VELLPSVVDLIFPTSVDRVMDHVHIFLDNAPDEEHLDVVLDRNKLRIIDTGLSRKLLTVDVELHLDWTEAEFWLVFQHSGLVALSVDYTVLLRLDSALLAGLSTIRQNRAEEWSISLGPAREYVGTYTHVQ
jgi:hypothetical protein